MATYATYIEEALRKAYVIAEGQTASAEQGADGLVVLNDMMNDLSGRGIDLGYVPTSTITGTLLLNPDWRQSIKCKLAVKLAAEYGTSPGADTVATATEADYRLQRMGVLNELTETTLRLPVGYGISYDIENDAL